MRRAWVCALAVASVWPRPAGAASVDPDTVPVDPATWTSTTTARTDDGKTLVTKSRYWRKGKKLRVESFEGDFGGRKLATVYCDGSVRSCWTFDAVRGGFVRGPFDPSVRDEGSWHKQGIEKVGARSCSVWVAERGRTGRKKAGEIREWRAGRFVMRRMVTMERSSVRVLGMVLPVPGRAESMEVSEIVKGSVADSDVSLPADAKLLETP